MRANTETSEWQEAGAEEERSEWNDGHAPAGDREWGGKAGNLEWWFVDGDDGFEYVEARVMVDGRETWNHQRRWPSARDGLTMNQQIMAEGK